MNLWNMEIVGGVGESNAGLNGNFAWAQRNAISGEGAQHLLRHIIFVPLWHMKPR
jgi:hypothetical protein